MLDTESGQVWQRIDRLDTKPDTYGLLVFEPQTVFVIFILFFQRQSGIKTAHRNLVKGDYAIIIMTSCVLDKVFGSFLFP